MAGPARRSGPDGDGAARAGEDGSGPLGEAKARLAAAVRRCEALSLGEHRLVGRARDLPGYSKVRAAPCLEMARQLEALCDLVERHAPARCWLAKREVALRASLDVRVAWSAKACLDLLEAVEASLARGRASDLDEARAAMAYLDEEMGRLRELLCLQEERLEIVTEALHEADRQAIAGSLPPRGRPHLRLFALSEALESDVTCPLEEVRRVASETAARMDAGSPGRAGAGSGARIGAPGSPPGGDADPQSRTGDIPSDRPEGEPGGERSRLAAVEGMTLPGLLSPPDLASAWRRLRASVEEG